ncbi:phytanoyl-CoA dioxygenase family protein [Dyadobacter pollutisoli]|uniref:Phytanoyl-CoA dioxygenase family protein n=1 Tax=Dyadobacter pollutisoli TaxID=2910158 RepID=A0A9E8NGT8_9BACT|nr:phytanoyl-CoA dioxygenase family protein [Dyadobacter pollutisoli]WAC13794.1 phytanoyl-CoA dioxygenase family protein [Dyadobacter pollutisoli]
MLQPLSQSQIEQFISKGYTKLENAFPEELARQGREILWKDTGCDPNDPTGWTRPVIRLGEYAQQPFAAAVNRPLLHQAFDQLVGAGKWVPRHSLGTFPVRFPSHDDPGDTGWHVDASFPGHDPYDYLQWRVNVKSKGRALLMLFLFSDIGECNAPTRIRVGSHLDVARALLPAGDAGLSFMELAGHLDITVHRPEVNATGKAGTVYLCHPFLAHAAQPNHGKSPRFMAQPPLLLKTEFDLNEKTGDYPPVEKAIMEAIKGQS